MQGGQGRLPRGSHRRRWRPVKAQDLFWPKTHWISPHVVAPVRRAGFFCSASLRQAPQRTILAPAPLLPRPPCAHRPRAPRGEPGWWMEPSEYPHQTPPSDRGVPLSESPGPDLELARGVSQAPQGFSSRVRRSKSNPCVIVTALKVSRSAGLKRCTTFVPNGPASAT